MIKSKHGDTLIEVTIAIGIFSMIAIAVASVMSSGTSGSQMALETTLAREEIDAQAEALRFIHSSYASSKRYEDSKIEDYGQSTNPYRSIWGQIISLANTFSGEEGDDSLNNIKQFAPSTCDELYQSNADGGSPNSIFAQKAFILNLKQLSNPSKAVIKANPDENNVFVPTTTYPRLVFINNNPDQNSDNESLTATKQLNEVYQAAGIYIVGVQDSESTNISGTKAAGFYDFYIRTCWYGTDASRPSNISTVVRLYNPDVK